MEPTSIWRKRRKREIRSKIRAFLIYASFFMIGMTGVIHGVKSIWE